MTVTFINIFCRILNEADYQKHKEIEYHEQTVAMNQAAMWFPMIQVIDRIYQLLHWHIYPFTFFFYLLLSDWNFSSCSLFPSSPFEVFF